MRGESETEEEYWDRLSEEWSAKVEGSEPETVSELRENVEEREISY